MKATTPRAKKTPRERAERRARRFLHLLKRSGAPLPSEEFVRKVVAKAERRDDELRQSREAEERALRELYESCRSITATARAFGIRRNDLSAKLESWEWVKRGPNGNLWPTSKAAADGLVISRGSTHFRWAQITQKGQDEIARRLGVSQHAKSPE